MYLSRSTRIRGMKHPLIILVRWAAICGVAALSFYELLPATAFTPEFPLSPDVISSLINMDDLAYWLGCAVCIILMLYYVFLRRRLAVDCPLFARFLDIAFAFSLLYCWGARSGIIHRMVWPAIWSLNTFFGAALLLRRRHIFVLLGFTCITAAIQCVFAIYYYTLRIHQFITPHFGYRTCGSYSSPNNLYPICMMVFLVALGMYFDAPASRDKLVFSVIGVAAITALVLTFERSGLIALLVGLLVYLIITRCPRKMNAQNAGIQRSGRIIATLSVVVILVCCGATLARTHGTLPGSSNDRSFQGRIAIWRVAAGAIREHPLFGTGVISFQSVQEHHMTSQLASFNPLNTEAKSLYLNLTVEMGFSGILVFLLAMYRFHRLSLSVIAALPGLPDRSIVAGIFAALVSLMTAALVDTPIFAPMRYEAEQVMAILVAAVCICALAQQRENSLSDKSEICSNKTGETYVNPLPQ